MQKLKTMWTESWNKIIHRKRVPPEKINPDDFAIIKLKKFDNLPMVIMADKENGGLAISYEDKHLDEPTKMLVQEEINAIISLELERLQNADL